jgi:hypothetical protein
VVRTRGQDESEQRVIDDVQRVGWHVVGVEADAEGPGFAYSIGLYHTFGQSEIILFGLDVKETMFPIVNLVGEQMRQDANFEDWYESDKLLESANCIFRNVEREHYAEYFGYAIWFYEGLEFPAMQCVWPDRAGNYPWELGFPPELKERQPVLTERIGWPFHEGKNRLVFTTRPVMERGMPVVLVTHNDDGDWQFLCGTTNDTADWLLVLLKNVAEKSPSIKELVDLPRGWQAIRESPDRPWQRMRL